MAPRPQILFCSSRQSQSIPISMPCGPNPSTSNSRIFGIPKLRTLFEDFDPLWPLQRSYCLENVRILSLSILGFHQNLSKILIFISQSPPFYENPISSVRPSETQKGRFLCVHPHSGGVVGFSIIGFWGTELLRLGEPLGGSWGNPRGPPVLQRFNLLSKNPLGKPT